MSVNYEKINPYIFAFGKIPPFTDPTSYQSKGVTPHDPEEYRISWEFHHSIDDQERVKMVYMFRNEYRHDWPTWDLGENETDYLWGDGYYRYAISQGNYPVISVMMYRDTPKAVVRESSDPPPTSHSFWQLTYDAITENKFNIWGRAFNAYFKQQGWDIEYKEDWSVKFLDKLKPSEADKYVKENPAKNPLLSLFPSSSLDFLNQPHSMLLIGGSAAGLLLIAFHFRGNR